jgi:PAS domain S-box-containing protein
MIKENKTVTDAAELRRKAEKTVASQSATAGDPDTKRLLHELQVHQLELEMQNNELRRAQVELEESRERYFDLYDLAPVAYVTLSEKDQILEANLTAATLLGLERSVLIKQPLSRFILKDDQEIFCRFRKQLFENGGPQVCELRIMSHDSSQFWARIEAAATQDAAGVSVCRAMISDITERKRVEEFIQIRMRLFKYAAEHTLEELLSKTLDEVGLLVDSPIGFYHFVEPDQKTLSLQAWSTLTHERFCKAEGKGFHYSIDTAGVWVDCVRQRKPVIHNDYASLPHRKGLPEGHAAVIRELVVPILRNDLIVAILGVGNKPREYSEQDVNSVNYLADVAWEIIEHKQAEEVQARLAAIVQSSDDAIIAKDLNGTILSWNAGSERLFGYRADEVIGKPISLILPPELQAEEGKILRRLSAGERIEHFETVRLTKDGRRVEVSLSSSPIMDSQGHIIGASKIAREITERKAAEAQLQRTLSDLERSNKELEQFAYVASHDLQEPLRMVASYTQLLAEHYEGQLDDKAKKFIDYAVDGAVRMHRLINDLLAFSRVNTQGEALELTDSHSVLGKALRNLSVAIEENRAIVINDDLPMVCADATQMIQLFQNLIGNAIKFRSHELPRIQVSACDLGREWRFSVKDNGIGIDMQYVDKVFVIFQRLHTRQEYPGTGIGLAICKRIVERHGGRIWFDSEPGKGSTFYFTLPK